MSADPRNADGSRPALEGLRVVEFTAAMAGPWIGRFLAWCGAEVIRVESKGRPDVVRLYVSPRNPELGTQPRCSPWFTDWNAGKRFVSLDLRKPEAIGLCERLISKSDAVIQNYSTGVLAKLGLDLEALQHADPKLIVLGSTGYGDRGPDRHYVTWGPNIEALSGLASLSVGWCVSGWSPGLTRVRTSTRSPPICSTSQAWGRMLTATLSLPLAWTDGGSWPQPVVVSTVAAGPPNRQKKKRIRPMAAGVRPG